MQITASEIVLTTSVMQQPKQPLPTEPKPALADAPTIPDVTVTLATPKAAPVVYEQPYIDAVQVRNTYDKGEQASKLNQQLSSELSSIRSKKSQFSVQSFFSQIGALSRETAEYKNEARTSRVPASKANDKLAFDFTAMTGKMQEMVTLRVRTKDGDTIDIQLQHNVGGNGDSLTFSFMVDGKLSAEEQNALEKIANKLGRVGDDFFRTGSTTLNGLAEFDKAQLKDFHIEFRTPKTEWGDDVVSYDYSVDEQANTQHLIAKDDDNYRIDITTQLKDAIGEINSGFDQSLQNYLSIIRHSLNEHQALLAENSNTPSTQFITDSFASMFTGNNANPSAEAKKTEQILDTFDTGLPDFTAKINGPLFQDHRNFLLPESLSLTLEQKTRQEPQDDGRILTQQTNSWQQKSSRIAGITGSNLGDLETGNYNYKTIHEQHQTTRILDTSQNELNNLITEQISNINNTEKTYVGFHLEDSKTEQRNERQLQQLTDEIAKHKHLKESFDAMQYVQESTRKIFN